MNIMPRQIEKGVRIIFIIVWDIITALLVLGIFLPPILLARWKLTEAGLIYLFYSRICHQDPGSSYFLWGYKLAVCGRCVGIYLALFIGGLVGTIVNVKPLSPRKFVWFQLPLVLDVVANLLEIYPTILYIKTLTGFLSGFGLTMFLLPRLKGTDKVSEA